MHFPGGSDGKASACNADPCWIPKLGRSPREGNGNPLQYSCLEIPWSRKESDKTERLHFHFLSLYIILFIYLFWAVLGLPCCADFSPVAVKGASRCGAALELPLRPAGFKSRGSQALEHRLNSCGPQAELPRGLWDLPRSGTEPASPAVTGGFLTSEPPGVLFALVC